MKIPLQYKKTIGGEVSNATSSAIFLRILKYLSPFRLPFIYIIVLMLLDVGYNVAVAWVQEIFIDTINQNNTAQLYWIIKISLAITLAVFALLFLQYFMRSYYQAAIQNNLANEVYNKLNGLSLKHIQKYHTGDLVSRITNDVVQTATVVGNVTYDLVSNILLCIISFVYLAQINVLLAIVAILTGPFVFLIGRLFDKNIKRVSRDIQGKLAEIQGILQEFTQGITTLKSYNMGAEKLAYFLHHKEMQNKLELRRTMYKAFMGFTIAITNTIILLITTFFISLAVIRGELTAGAVLAFIFLMFRVQGPFRTISNSWGLILQGISAAERIFGLLDIAEGKAQNDEQHIREGKPHDTRKVIQLKNVSFSYQSNDTADNVPNVDNVSLDINEGEIVAIVGPSGSGKSTLARICTGLYQPDSGEVTVFGAASSDSSQINPAITYLPQVPYLFSGTIRDSILMGNSATEEQIIKAAKEANIHETIMQLEHQYDTRVGENAYSLSGGQKQRIAIARAFLKNSPLVIMDEATSALDIENERLIHNSITTLLEDKTAIIIAHRLTTIKNASRIIVMEKGKIAEQGSHEELMARQGLYYQLSKITK